MVSYGGGIGGLVVDTIGHSFSQKYHNRVIQHEAGHFLIAYLVGRLPRGYTISSLDALQKVGSLNIEAGTAFVDFEFQEEVGKSAASESRTCAISRSSTKLANALEDSSLADVFDRVSRMQLQNFEKGRKPCVKHFSNLEMVLLEIILTKKRYCFATLHLSRHLLSFDLDIFYQCREVIYGTQKEGEGNSNNDGQTQDPSLTDDVANNDDHQMTDVDWRNSTTFIPSPTWTSSKPTTVGHITCR
ncbi:hypothetical protein JHK87_028053 [Glycine soja]|nr:hypothetical protein JHK87_028053 [Glycine soja]